MVMKEEYLFIYGYLSYLHYLFKDLSIFDGFNWVLVYLLDLSDYSFL